MLVWAWAGFLIIVGVILAIDLGVLNRQAHVVKMREALAFTAFTIVLATVFAGLLYFAYDGHWLGLGGHIDRVDGATNSGRLAALKFFTGYLVELSLSMDNVFVIALIFQHLRVPAEYQHRVLFWGILGALLMRGAMIGLGAGLVARYEWVLYVFGAFLIVTAIRMLASKDEHEAPDEAAVIRFLRRHFRVADRYHGQHFIVTLNAKWYLTPLAVALVLVETTDLIFAVDSIPAIFAITADPFLVFTSNVFAILCLRSLYFGLAGLIAKFRYLKVSLALILGIVGAKMLAGHSLREIVGPHLNMWLLALIALILVGGAAASALIPAPKRDA
ncbi:MAG TPA: TerC family protein [Gemmatimonadaceae bacterium]|nr:TerC family protein [Gemmatimonadaceae bacterium]